MDRLRHRAQTRFAPLVMLVAPVSFLTGCFGHLSPAQASMGRVEAPVLLGPVDHVGGGPPLAFEKTGDFEASAKHINTHSEDANYTYDTEIVESDTNAQAEYATRGDAFKDIRLTEIKPQAVGVLVSSKSRVDLYGDVVRVKPAKGDAP